LGIAATYTIESGPEQRVHIVPPRDVVMVSPFPDDTVGVVPGDAVGAIEVVDRGSVVVGAHVLGWVVDVSREGAGNEILVEVALSRRGCLVVLVVSSLSIARRESAAPLDGVTPLATCPTAANEKVTAVPAPSSQTQARSSPRRTCRLLSNLGRTRVKPSTRSSQVRRGRC
jgi:hypothetical protein